MTNEEKMLLLQFFLAHGTRLFYELEEARDNFIADPSKTRLLEHRGALERFHEFERVKLCVSHLLHMDSDNPD